jgi:hypothetical protein
MFYPRRHCLTETFCYGNNVVIYIFLSDNIVLTIIRIHHKNSIPFGDAFQNSGYGTLVQSALQKFYNALPAHNQLRPLTVGKGVGPWLASCFCQSRSTTVWPPLKLNNFCVSNCGYKKYVSLACAVVIQPPSASCRN